MTWNRFVRRSVLGLICSGAVAATPPAGAEQAGLEGAWSGGGQVVFASGDRERARCRASFSRSSGSSYRMDAVCATASARVAQSAELRRVSATHFSGNFHNPEYNFSGVISIVLRGNQLSAQLRGDGATANLALNR